MSPKNKRSSANNATFSSSATPLLNLFASGEALIAIARGSIARVKSRGYKGHPASSPQQSKFIGVFILSFASGVFV